MSLDRTARSRIAGRIFLAFGLWWSVGLLDAADPAPADSSPADKEQQFQPLDVFQLEYAADPQISPDGRTVVYERTFFDIMKDQRRSNLWAVSLPSGDHRPWTSGPRSDFSPRWSPDGTRVAYVSNADGSPQLYCRWVDTGAVARLTQLPDGPSALTWSPDGRWLALVLPIPAEVEPFVKLPGKPEGATWAEPATVIRKLRYRADGAGYLKDEFQQIFVVPAEGGTPRQLTSGDYDHEGPLSWTPDGKALLFSAKRTAKADHEPLNSEVHEVRIDTREIRTLTTRFGPDNNPVVSPDGKWIAYLGFDDRQQGYQLFRLYVMQRDGSGSRCLTAGFDRELESPVWSQDSRGVYCQYDDEGNTKVGFVDLSGKVTPVCDHVGGTTIGRPYASGTFSVSREGLVAFTQGIPERPSDVGLAGLNRPTETLTSLNADLLGARQMGRVEEFRFRSTVDNRSIHGWLVYPPGFDPAAKPAQKYPLLLEIHGGPFANYGSRFSAEMQLYAAAGYVVLYCNPRGSTSYGEEFGNLIHHDYPGRDYHDLMSGVDEVLKRGFIDERRLYVTGGSGGGILTAWIVGQTSRFRAAVSAKPVINWYSFALTADMYPFFTRYWFPGFPWEHAEHYLKRSPLTYVGNVTTPTMLLTGEKDYRTPISEAEQFYQALQLRKIDSALVRMPGASHDISARPSQLISQVLHTLEWFKRHP